MKLLYFRLQFLAPKAKQVNFGLGKAPVLFVFILCHSVCFNQGSELVQSTVLFYFFHMSPQKERSESITMHE